MPADLRSPFDLSMPDPPADDRPSAGARLDAEFDLAYDEDRPEVRAAEQDEPASPRLWYRLAALPWPRIGQFLALQFFIVVLVVVALPELVPRRAAPQVTVRPAPAPETGAVAVVEPRSAPPGVLTVSLVRYGDIAKAADGTALDRLPLRSLERKRLEPALYLAQFEYRGRRVEGSVIDVKPGQRTTLAVPGTALADIEYRTGLRHARGGRDIPYFRRAVRLDPGHVAAHLQLAAYELLRGSPRRARGHLAAVRKKEPGNPYAARISRLLQRRGGRAG